MTHRYRANHSASVDPLGQRDDDSRRPAHMGHPPGVLVLTDPTDQSVSVRSQAVDGRLEVVDLETDAAQTQLVSHRGGRSGLVVGPDEARELDPGSSVGRP